MAGAVALTVAALDAGLAAGVVLLDAVLFPDPLQRQARETLVTALEGPHWLEALRGLIGARMFSPFDPPELKPRIIDPSLDDAIQVREGDVVLVPCGYHPVAAGPGYDLYYLNVMAGPRSL